MDRRRFLGGSLAAITGATASSLGDAPPLRAAEPAPSPAPAAATGRYPLLGFTKPFQKLGYEETADTVAAVGWNGIECPVRPNGQGQIDPERAADELPKLIQALRQRGKELTMIATYITSLREPHTESLLRTAARLGIRRYRLGFLKYDLTRPIPPQVAEICAQLRDLAAFNRELGLQAGFQNHSGAAQVGGPAWDLWTMLKEVDPKWVGTCFDIAHATIEGGLNHQLQAQLLEPHFMSVVIKDFVWAKGPKGWRVQWTPLGEGMVTPAFVTWLKTTRFAGPIIQHHEYDHGSGAPMIAKMRQDLAVLRSWLAA